MRQSKLLIVCSLLLVLAVISRAGFSMMCPTNFNTIEIGYTIDRIIQLCGNPDERTEYKETIKFSSVAGGGQGYGSVIVGSSSAYAQSTGSYQRLQDEKERVLIITKFFYQYPQPSILTFVDGILREKQL